MLQLTVQPHNSGLGSSAAALQCSMLHLRKLTMLGRSFATHYLTSGRRKISYKPTKIWTLGNF